MSKGRWAALAVFVLAALAAVWAVQHFRKGSAPPGPQVASVQLFKSPMPVPAFSLTDLEGRQLTSTDWRGKVVLINFWATWCTPCRVEIPDLIALQNKYRDQLVIIGVSEDEPSALEEVKKFVADQNMNYPVAMSTPELRKIFRGVVALPTTFVLNQEGNVEQRHVGMLNKENTEAETRVLAGLDPDVMVERIEGDERVRLANAAEAKSIPGVDISHLSDPQRKAVIQALIAEDCTCGCHLSVAECRLDDLSCPVSLPLAQDIVKQYSAQP